MEGKNRLWLFHGPVLTATTLVTLAVLWDAPKRSMRYTTEGTSSQHPVRDQRPSPQQGACFPHCLTWKQALRQLQLSWTAWAGDPELEDPDKKIKSQFSWTVWAGDPELEDPDKKIKSQWDNKSMPKATQPTGSRSRIQARGCPTPNPWVLSAGVVLTMWVPWRTRHRSEGPAQQCRREAEVLGPVGSQLPPFQHDSPDLGSSETSHSGLGRHHPRCRAGPEAQAPRRTGGHGLAWGSGFHDDPV